MQHAKSGVKALRTRMAFYLRVFVPRNTPVRHTRALNMSQFSSEQTFVPFGPAYGDAKTYLSDDNYSLTSTHSFSISSMSLLKESEWDWYKNYFSATYLEQNISTRFFPGICTSQQSRLMN